MTSAPAPRMPAEWEPHAATWLGWPEKESDWPGKLEAVRWAFVEVVRHVAARERVEMLVASEASLEDARDRLSRALVPEERVRLHLFPTDRTWLRDSGAIFVREGADARGRLAAKRFAFNAWAKYDDYERDRAIPALMAETADVPISDATIRAADGSREAPFVLEGGAIDANGAGLALVTEECLLSDVQARNPGFSREDVERALRDSLGVERTIWLPGGIDGDDTHGHVDDCARFAGERVVLAVEDDDRSAPHFETLRRNVEILRAWRDEKGALDVRVLPMPGRLEFEDLVLPASYANFYVCNGAVLVPTFNDPRDRDALAIVAEAFPGREVRGVHSVDLIWGLGSIHCMTQQQPSE